MMQQVTDKIRFFYSFVKSPRTVGSITPSSSFLTKRMFQDVEWNQAQVIVELGAGTGVFTDWINQNLSFGAKAIVFERDEKMRNLLKRRFPKLHFASDGLMMRKILDEIGIKKVDYIISSLPFANFSSELRSRFLELIYETLKPGGSFIAYQYSRQMKPQLQKTFSHVEISLVPFNIPPAFVYTCRK